jgi:hypothetical protein
LDVCHLLSLVVKNQWSWKPGLVTFRGRLYTEI